MLKDVSLRTATHESQCSLGSGWPCPGTELGPGLMLETAISTSREA
jgi:hypothetical protein